MCSNHWFIHLSMYLFFQLESTVNLFLTKVASGYCKVFPRTPEHLRQSENSSTWPSNNAGNTWKTFSFSEPGFDLKGGEKGKNCPVKQFSLCRVVHEDKCWYFALRLRFVTSACNTAVEACFWECVERCLLKFIFVFRKFRALSLSNGLIWELNLGISCNLIMCAQELMESLVLRSTFIFTVAFSAVFLNLFFR